MIVIGAAVAIFRRKADLLRKVRCFDDDWRRALHSQADFDLRRKMIGEAEMLIRALFAAALLISPARAASPQSEGFKRLAEPQIWKVFSGKLFSDGVHFSYRFAAGGTMQSTRMGKTTTDKWTVAKDKLCMTDTFGENCYTVWAKGSAVKFAIDGSDFSLEGFLK